MRRIRTLQVSTRRKHDNFRVVAMNAYSNLLRKEKLSGCKRSRISEVRTLHCLQADDIYSLECRK